MKIKPEHFEKMKAACEAVVAAHQNVAAEYRAAGHSEMRYRWDVLHAAKIDGQPSRVFICDVLYEYAHDEHIDTALRSIFNHPKRDKGDKRWLDDAQASTLKSIGKPDPLKP
jgi:hypothetical protein